MNLDRLSLGEKLFAACGLVLFVLSFLKLWAKVELESDFGDATQRFSGWDGYGFLVDLAFILALVGVVLVIVRATQASVSLPWSNVYRGIGIAVAVLLVLALVVGPDESGAVSTAAGSIEISRGIGLFIGALLALGMAAGAWLHSDPGGSAGAVPA